MGLRIIIILLFLSSFGFSQDDTIYTLTNEDMNFILNKYREDGGYFYNCGVDSVAKWKKESEALEEKILSGLEDSTSTDSMLPLFLFAKLRSSKDDTTKYFMALGHFYGWLDAMAMFEELVVEKYNDRLKRLSTQRR